MTIGHKISEGVYRILEQFPETRNDDRVLMIKYWSMYDEIPFDESFPENFAIRGTSPETITRQRRKIQERGEFLPTLVTVQERRNKREREFREHFARN